MFTSFVEMIRGKGAADTLTTWDNHFKLWFINYPQTLKNNQQVFTFKDKTVREL